MITPRPDGLRLAEVALLGGPSPLSSDPVLVVRLYIGERLRDRAREVAARAHARFPAWVPPPADDGTADSIVGLALARWSLGALNSVRGCLRAAGAVDFGDGIVVFVGWHEPTLTRRALKMAADALLDDGDDESASTALAVSLDSLGRACRIRHPDYQASILIRAAREMNLPHLALSPGARIWQFGSGRFARSYFESASDRDSSVGTMIARSKATSKEFLRGLGLPVAKDSVVGVERELEAAAASVGFPCVTKPLDRGGGKGVIARIEDFAGLLRGYRYAREYTTGPVMVERHVEGDDHRLMVIGGKLVAAIRREPAHVIGDGLNSVGALVEALNRQRDAVPAEIAYLCANPLDTGFHEALALQRLDIDDVPERGQRVQIRTNSNISTGGVCTDVSALVHPQIRVMAERVARASGLHVCGVDYLTTDITRPWQETGGALTEFNATPGIDVLLAIGMDPVRTGALVIGGDVDAMPLTLVVIDAAAAASAPSFLRESSLSADTGWMVDDVAWAGVGEPVTMAGGDSSPDWIGAKALFRTRELSRAVLVCSTTKLLQRGLPASRFVDAIVGDRSIPGSWMRLIDAHSESLRVVDDWRSALASVR